MSEQLPISDCLPLYTSHDRNKDLGREEIVKRKAFQNDLCVQLNRLMDHFGIEAADIVRGTNIEFSTLSGWLNYKVETQLLDSNIKEVARFMGLSVDYIAYSTPMSERDFEVENAICEKEEKSVSA